MPGIKRNTGTEVVKPVTQIELVEALAKSRKLMQDLFIRYEDPQENLPVQHDDIDSLVNQIIEIDKLFERMGVKPK